MERVVNRKNPLSEISIPPHPLPPLKRLTLPVISYIYVLLIYTDDWKCDQYRWVNQGVTKLPHKDPIIRKLYFSLDTPNGPCSEFKRYGYQLICDQSFTLIHYLGDESVANDFPHGNSMKEGAFIRTCPSYLSKCRSLLKIDRASVVYKKRSCHCSM